ncbi:MAG: PD-(D/E)XK nuclease family protein, partial [Myxococcota bacterium]
MSATHLEATARLSEATAFLASYGPAEPLWVIGERRSTARQFLRSSGGDARIFAEPWSVMLLARHLAAPTLANAGGAIAGFSARTAVAARVIANATSLGSLAAVADAPGLARALVQLADECRMRRVTLAALGEYDDDLQGLLEAYESALEAERLYDDAAVLRAACDALGARPIPPVVALDLHLEGEGARFLEALLEGAPATCVTHAPSSRRTGNDEPGQRDLDVLRRRLFRQRLFQPTGSASPQNDGSVTFMSAPGESAECVEIARRILASDLPFDRMAVVLRSPQRYIAALQSALRRAAIPFSISAGVRRPDPSGRAFLALLECAERDLSAHAFADYLAFGVMPDRVSGAPPPARELFEPGDEYGDLDEALDADARFLAAVATDPYAHHRALQVPRRFEQLLVDAAVIGGRERWVRRLDGLEARYAGDEEPLADLQRLRAFALPILDDLVALPEGGTWGDWIDALSALATRALHAPERVIEVLQGLTPMAQVGPVGLREVRRSLSGPLGDLRVAASRLGAVHILDAIEVRGLSFEGVFIPGLAERLWPERRRREALLSDRARVELGLCSRAERMDEERDALLRALGAARRWAVLSWPRIDASAGRVRVPSTFFLEAQAVFDEAPEAGELLAPIDVAEYDAQAAQKTQGKDPGSLAYMLDSATAARVLRRRAGRWDSPKWTAGDGFYAAELGAHRLGERAFSATGLQRFAACPLQFAYAQIVRLSVREFPATVDALDPRERGSLVHTIQFRCLEALRERRLLPTGPPGRLEQALKLLHEITLEAADEAAARLKPAIERVWHEGVRAIESDLRRWLRELDPEWEPTHYELAFGMPKDREQDASSVPAPITLDAGITLRGSIDLVETHASGKRRATDHKTGRDRHREGLRIGGGEVLQPALYALALEKLFGGEVTSGRLHFCTHRGAFRAREVALTKEVRSEVAQLAKLIDGFVERGFLPAHPSSPRSCE